MAAINDGTGKGNVAKVDGNNRLHTGTVSRSERNAAISKEDAFLFGSTVIDLTDSGNFTPVTYIENTSDQDLVIQNIFLSLGDTTNGSGNGYFTVWKNCTSDSGIVQTATQCPVTNMNIGSNAEFQGNAYIGATGENFSGGTGLHTTILQPSITNIIDIDIPLIITKGQNVFFTVNPPTGNTSMEVMLAITVFYLDDELAD